MIPNYQRRECWPPVYDRINRTRRPLAVWTWAVTFGGAVAAVAVGWAVLRIRARTRRQT